MRRWRGQTWATAGMACLISACSSTSPQVLADIVAPPTTLPATTSTTRRPPITFPPAAPTTTIPAIDLGAETGLQGWNVGSAAGRTAFERDTDKARSGDASFRLTAGPAGGAVLNDSPNRILAAAANRCTATAWVSGPPGVDVRLVLREYDGDVRVGVTETEFELPDAEWHQLTAQLTVVPGSSIDLNIRTRELAAGESLWIDDLTEECVDVAETPAPAIVVADGDPVIVAAGSIACAGGVASPECGQAATAAVTAGLTPTRVLPIGNLQPGPALSGIEVAASYGPFPDRASWGDFAQLTSPTIGASEYVGSDVAAGYFGYWHDLAAEPGAYGDPGDGWYAQDIGTWRVIHLNTERAYEAGGAQDLWLAGQLIEAGDRCVAIVASRQPFGDETGATQSADLFTTAYTRGADLWLAADVRRYERFAPQDPAGAVDEAHGIPVIVAGTGGQGLDPAPDATENRAVVEAGRFGVVRLTLAAAGFDWAFHPVDGVPVDDGLAGCHPAPPTS